MEAIHATDEILAWGFVIEINGVKYEHFKCFELEHILQLGEGILIFVGELKDGRTIRYESSSCKLLTWPSYEFGSEIHIAVIPTGDVIDVVEIIEPIVTEWKYLGRTTFGTTVYIQPMPPTGVS